MSSDADNPFGYFAFCTDKNSSLPFNIACHISADGIAITAMLPAGIDLGSLVPDFAAEADVFLPDGTEVISGTTALDCTSPLELVCISSDGSESTLTVTIETLDTGLPSMAVTLEDYVDVYTIKKENYTNASFYLGGGDPEFCSYAPTETVQVDGKLKGRGNSSWMAVEKKGYTVKLDDKTALLDMPASKNWTLISNYEDKSLMHNLMGSYFAHAAGIPYIMEMRPVDMWINGMYWGTYNLAEKIEIEPDRVAITGIEKPDDKDFVDLAADEIGYILEFDSHVIQYINYDTGEWYDISADDWQSHGWTRFEHSYYDAYAEEEKTGAIYYNPATDETFFQVPYLGDKWVTIKEPSTENLEYNPELRDYIFRKVMELDAALKNRQKNPERVAELIDLDSLARWVLVQEMMDNTDASFHSSVYMTLDVNGKFVMGPVWDFDRSCGTSYYWAYDFGSIIDGRIGVNWCRYAFDTPAGRQVLLDAYDEFYQNIIGGGDLPAWQDQIAEYQTLLQASSTLNFQRWDILNQQVGANPDFLTNCNTFDLQVAFLKNWLWNRRTDMILYMNNY